MSLYNRFRLLTLSILLVLGFLCIPEESKSQGLGNSPYSSVGIGESYGDSYSDATGMGQSGVSTANGFQINNLNPALWVRNRFTTLDVGLVAQYKDIVSGSKHQQNAAGNLAYVSLAFPISSKWVLGVSMKPYSFVDYENTSIKTVPGTAALAYYNTTGKGGINKASVTNAFRIGKYLSLGLETSYFFGNVRKTTEVSLPVSGSDYLVSLNERTTYSDIAFRAGGALRLPVKKNKMNLNLGAAYSITSKINANQTTSFEVTQSTFNVIDPDTLANNVGGSLTVPNQFQVGASLEWPLKLVISADYNRQYWSQYRSFTNSNDNLKDIGKLNLGVEYLPRFSSLNYFDIVRYRLGFSYGSTPYTISNKNVKDASVSLGLTFPMGRGYQNFLSFALVGGQRGAPGTGQVRERYGKLVLGITLLDNWFVKQKVD